VAFRVPDATDLNRLTASDSDPNVLRPDFSDSGAVGQNSAVAGGGVKKEPQIEFLCPNGHRLFGAASLQGKPGECPECGSRFYIPTCESVSVESGSKLRLNRSEVQPGSANAASPPTAPEQSVSQSPVAKQPAGSEAMAALAARLARICPKGTTIEVRLRSGETFSPSQFLEKASRASGQGVFATAEADGTVSLVAVSWDAVERMAVRGLKEIPGEMRD
jgi:hypothetical protein